MFSVSFGSENRERKIKEFSSKNDHCTAVILAAVHFEWMIKRAILKLGISPTKALREKLEDIYRLYETDDRKDYKSVWEEEVAVRFSNSKLGTVLGVLSKIQNETSKVRGKIVHGNGTVSKKEAIDAVDQYLKAAKKIRDFAKKYGEDLDSRLIQRRKARTAK